MTTAPTKTASQPTPATIEDVLFRDDLSDLSPDQRTTYVVDLCNSLGLNWRTRPFSYLTLNGKLVLYAKKDCTEQLRKINGISLNVVSRELEGGLMIVHVRATDKTGRTDEDFGVVPFKNQGNEFSSNAMMKAITKAKRRVTLSISGLGFLDESEVESIVPRQPREALISKDQHQQLLKTAAEVGADLPTYLAYLSDRWETVIATLNDIPAQYFDDALGQLERKRGDKKKLGHDPETGEVTDANT
jgi:hypothetical protein